MAGLISGASTHNTDQVPLTGTAAQILPQNGGRVQGTITNTSSSTAVYIGGANVTTANGGYLPPGASYTTYSSGAWWGVTAGSTITVSYIDETQ